MIFEKADIMKYPNIRNIFIAFSKNSFLCLRINNKFLTYDLIKNNTLDFKTPDCLCKVYSQSMNIPNKYRILFTFKQNHFYSWIYSYDVLRWNIQPFNGKANDYERHVRLFESRKSFKFFYGVYIKYKLFIYFTLFDGNKASKLCNDGKFNAEVDNFLLQFVFQHL